MIQTRGQLLGVNMMRPRPFLTKIKFGHTTLADYEQVAQLGKGTYGEVFKAVHKVTNELVAIKSFFFEVSPILKFSDLIILINYRMSPME
jgi:serine/threonine protein kinase